MSEKPNIIMMTCHDLGQHLGCYGVDTVRSDAIDELADEGCRVASYFATSPTCSPSRGCMLTGRYPQTNGLLGLTHGPWWWRLNPGERHLAAILADSGYETTLIGFQHVTRGGDGPTTLGYGTYLPGGDYAEDKAAEAERYLKERDADGGPLFLKIGFEEVHRPFDKDPVQPDRSRGITVPGYLKDTQVMRDDLAWFQGIIRYMDRAVGRVLDAVRDTGMAKNSIVIFTSDHGIPYIGAKWTLFDPGISIPLIVRWPAGGVTGGRVVSRMMSNVDFVPTLLELAGLPVPDNVQGLSGASLLKGESEEPIREAVFAEHQAHALRDNTSRCIRTERYKLIRNFDPGRTILKPIDVKPQAVADHVERPRRNGTRPFGQLFDLQQDPWEERDLSGDPQHADVSRELSDALWRWMEEVEDPILQGPIRTPYYERAMEDYARYCSE